MKKKFKPIVYKQTPSDVVDAWHDLLTLTAECCTTGNSLMTSRARKLHGRIFRAISFGNLPSKGALRDFIALIKMKENYAYRAKTLEALCYQDETTVWCDKVIFPKDTVEGERLDIRIDHVAIKGHVLEAGKVINRDILIARSKLLNFPHARSVDAFWGIYSSNIARYS